MYLNTVVFFFFFLFSFVPLPRVCGFQKPALSPLCLGYDKPQRGALELLGPLSPARRVFLSPSSSSGILQSYKNWNSWSWSNTHYHRHRWTEARGPDRPPPGLPTRAEGAAAAGDRERGHPVNAGPSTSLVRCTSENERSPFAEARAPSSLQPPPSTCRTFA